MSELDHWFVRIDRYASVHLVRSQDMENSCGMSSLCMVNFKMKKYLMAAGLSAGAAVQSVPVPGANWLGYQLGRAAVRDAVRSEASVRAMYERHKGSAHDFETTGAIPSFYPLILRDLGLGNWERVNVGQAGLAQAAIDACAGGKCCMLGVSWPDGSGHAVVCDEVHTVFGTKLCICDPWDGQLRLVDATVGSPVTYNASYEPLSFSLGGERRSYSPGSVGVLNGGITRRV
jgi:hypothetical protein